jgi:hypothetical protein
VIILVVANKINNIGRIERVEIMFEMLEKALAWLDRCYAEIAALPTSVEISSDAKDYTVYVVGNAEDIDVDGETAVVKFGRDGATMIYLDIDGIDIGIRAADRANSALYNIRRSELEQKVYLTAQIVERGYRYLRRAQRHAVTVTVWGRRSEMHVINAPEITEGVLCAARLINDDTRITSIRRIARGRKDAAVIGRVGDVFEVRLGSRDVELRFRHRWDENGRSQVYVSADGSAIVVGQFWYEGWLYGAVSTSEISSALAEPVAA